MRKFILLSNILLILFLTSCSEKKENIKVQKYQKGFRYNKDGWIYLHIEGEPRERGFQHGYLLATEFQKAFEIYSAMMYETMGIKMDFLISEATKMQKDKIPQELLEEMRGIANGITARGFSITLDDIIGWNAFIGLSEGWWSTVKSDYASYIPLSVGNRREKCSAFIATGDATKDNKIVIGHSSFDDFWNAQVCNVILDIKPDKGNTILMQTTPGYVASMTDFFIMSSGIFGLETSLSGFNGFDLSKDPCYVSQRLAMQYADTIEKFVDILNKSNDGGNPASWLIGDIKTNEIARYEQGIKFQSFEKKKNGYFFGCNVAFDPRIRNLECDGEGFNDIRRHTGGRKARFPMLLDKYYGIIDDVVAKHIMSDHFDVYLKKTKPGANTICSHYDEDERKSMSSMAATHPDPYTPAGAVDCLITTSDMVKNMKCIGRFGRPCGKPFNKDKFFKLHPQWNWQKDYLNDRPTNKWVTFSSYKK